MMTTMQICCFCGTVGGKDEEKCSGCGASFGMQWDLLPVGYKLCQGQYQIERVLGRGGFGITYRAIDVQLSRAVAIKEFYPQHCARRNIKTYELEASGKDEEVYQKALSRFEQEGRILAQINHGNVVRVYSLFKELNSAYLVMELLEGQSLGGELEGRENKALSERLVKRIINHLVEALSCTHQKGIYHLDIKPDNVLITRDGRIVLVDFGAARWLDVRSGEQLRSIAAYTPEYAPLELLNGEEVGVETDIYEVGALCYELLTGKRPPSAWERMREAWEPQGFKEPWQTLLVSALALERDERPRDIREWWYAGMQPEQVQATRPAGSWRFQMRSLYQRWRYKRGIVRWLIASGGLISLLLFSYGGWVVFTENNLSFRKQWAERASARGQWGEALRHYNRAIQLNPSGELYEARGDVRLRLTDFNGAILDYQEALRLQGQAPGELQAKLGRAYLSLGDHLHEQRNFGQAIINYREAMRVHPPLADVANAQIQQSQFGQAVERYQNQDYVSSIELHEALLRQEKLASSFREQVGNSLAQVFLDYGLQLVERKSYEEALRAFSRGLEQKPTIKKLEAELYKNRALEYVRKQDYDLALNDYNAALKLQEHPDYYQGRAFVRSQTNDLLNAIADYSRAEQLGAKDTLTYVGRGEVSLRLKDYRSAVDDFNKALAIEGNHTLALLHRGWALYHLRTYRQAVLDLQRVIELDPSIAEAYEGLGYAKYEVGDRRGSHRDLERAIELYRKDNRTDRIDAILNWRKAKGI